MLSENHIHLNKKRGYFEFKNIRFVPYKHHISKNLWKVLVTKMIKPEILDDDIRKMPVTSWTVNVCALSPKEASLVAFNTVKSEIGD